MRGTQSNSQSLACGVNIHADAHKSKSNGQRTASDHLNSGAHQTHLSLHWEASREHRSLGKNHLLCLPDEKLRVCVFMCAREHVLGLSKERH